MAEIRTRTQQGVDEASKGCFTWLVTFLTITAYVAVITAGTTDAQLVRKGTVELPLLKASLEVVPFYALFPPLYVALFTHLLLQLAILKSKAIDMHVQCNSLPETERPTYLRSLHSFALHYLPSGIAPRLSVRLAFRSVLFFSVAVLPVVMLCWMQRQFLPYHSALITGCHRVCVAAVLILLWIFRTVLSPVAISSTAHSETSAADVPSKDITWFRRLARSTRIAMRGAFGYCLRTLPRTMLMAAALFLSLSILSLPDETCDILSRWRQMGPSPTQRFLEAADRAVHRNLVLREALLVNDTPSPELTTRINSRDAGYRTVKGVDLRNRDLRYADFSRACLVNADLRGAILNRTDFERADLRGANFGDPRPGCAFGFKEDVSGDYIPLLRKYVQIRTNGPTILTHVNLVSATLDDATFGQAYCYAINMYGASARRTAWQGAILIDADAGHCRFDEADLHEARIQGGKFSGAEFPGANLSQIRAFGGSYRPAIFDGASFEGAELIGVDFFNSTFKAAYFRRAMLDGVELSESELEGADFTYATLTCVSLWHSRVGQATFSDAVIELSDLRGIDCEAIPVEEWTAKEQDIHDRITGERTRKDIAKLFQAAQLRESVRLIQQGVKIKNCLMDEALGQPTPRASYQMEQFERARLEHLCQLGSSHAWVIKQLIRRAWVYRARGDAKPSDSRDTPESHAMGDQLAAELYTRVKQDLFKSLANGCPPVWVESLKMLTDCRGKPLPQFHLYP